MPGPGAATGTAGASVHLGEAVADGTSRGRPAGRQHHADGRWTGTAEVGTMLMPRPRNRNCDVSRSADASKTAAIACDGHRRGLLGHQTKKEFNDEHLRRHYHR